VATEISPALVVQGGVPSRWQVSTRLRAADRRGLVCRRWPRQSPGSWSAC